MAQLDMSSAFNFFAAIAIISGLIYLLQTSNGFDLPIGSNTVLAIAIISGAIAVWTRVS